MDLLSIKKRVETLLQISPECRECDARLVACIWNRQLRGIIENMSAMDLLKELSADRLKDYESITRVARKLKEKNPLYRGKNYVLRMEEQEHVKDQIKVM